MIFLLILVFVLAIPAFLFWHLHPAIRFFRYLNEPQATATQDPDIRTAQGDLKVEIYRKAGSLHSTLIVVPGLHPLGIYDPRFRLFSQSCAQVGFLVVAPDLLDLRNAKVTVESPRQITKLVNNMRSHVPSEAQRNIGILGISYAAGLVFISAAQHAREVPLQFLISLGGYYDFAHFLRFVVTGTHVTNGDTHIRTPDPWGRMIFALNYLDDFISNEQEKTRQVLQLHLQLKNQEAEQAAAALSPEASRFMGEVMAGFSGKNLEIFERIMTRDRRQHQQLSPAYTLESMDRRMRFYLVHGKNDHLVPYEETLEFAVGLKQAGARKVHSLVTASLTHVDLKKSEDISGTIRMLFWLNRVMSEAKK